MAFRNNPVLTGTPPGTPVGSVATPNEPNGDLTALEGGPKSGPDSNSNYTAPASIWIKDGNNVTQGLTTDAAVVGDNPGTISGKLRGLSKIFNDVWDSVNHRLHVSVDNATALGQANMANSSPVVVASDQTPVPLGLYPADGPVDASGKSQTSVYDKLASLQGKALAGASGNITATVAGDTNLGFSVAPKTIVPTQKIQLSVGAGNAVETVIVSSSYVPSNTATSIPLQYPVVLAGSTTAKWDVHSPLGPANTLFLPTDIGLMSTALTDPAGSGQVSTAAYAGSDNQSVNRFSGMVPHLLNGAGFGDKQRGNLDVQLLASAARTTTQTSADIVNYNGRGIKVWLIVTSAGTGSITLAINAKDPGSVSYVAQLTGAAVTTNSTNIYTIYPGLTAVANTTVNDILPRTFQIVVTVNNANSMTYSVGYSIIV